ncbi:GDYXXLXY domain-containing protein [Deefgea rivuli]|uniref:GDYXXLXY domain-containing protein n=1 Tax=Deefgea rivuli TaxID=400948 RepID=UPI0004868014|nr:GDYXXLXY domain-containing protein [Deefgea rivuli]
MSLDRLHSILSQAIAAGVLPADAMLEQGENRPWPVVVLIAIGAWLAAIPLLIVTALLMGDFVTHEVAGPYVVGAPLVLAAVCLLRKRHLALFVEQLAIPTLLVGCGVLGFGFFEHWPSAAASLAMALLVISIIWAIEKSWLRVLLGATAAVFVGMACWIALHDWESIYRTKSLSFWWTLHGLLLFWLFALCLQRVLLHNGSAAIAAAIEAASSGWVLVLIVGLALWSGMTFLVGASFGELFRELDVAHAVQNPSFLSIISVLFAAAAAGYLAYFWAALRQPWCCGVALVLVGLAALMPSLGAVLLVLAVAAATTRWRIASAAGLAAAWIIGAFYYQLNLSLAYKALLLMSAGAVLGGLAWIAPRQQATVAAAGRAGWTPQKLNVGISAALLSTLLVLNIGIWQKEQLIAKGEPVYVALMPVDPRSLMQGDFMRLNYEIPNEITESLDGLLLKERPYVVAKRDEKRIATVLRLDKDLPLAADEFRIQLSPQDGRWVLVSDAWFFKEGEAARWSVAKYAEFRVDKNGKALLLGLRGANLQPL